LYTERSPTQPANRLNRKPLGGKPESSRIIFKKGGKMKRARQTIKAGLRGTKKLVDKFGTDLLFVGYYYDIEKHKKITTVEIVTDTIKWEPKKIPPTTIVKLKVGIGEYEIQRKIKEKGGKWNREKGVWELAFGKVKELGLQSRLVRK
jgi:hypothetical protein